MSGSILPTIEKRTSRCLVQGQKQCGKILKGKFDKISTRKNLKIVTKQRKPGELTVSQEKRAMHHHNYKKNRKYHQPSTLLRYRIFQTLPMFTLVYLCLTQFIRASRRLFVFTYVYHCLLVHVYQYSPRFTCVYLRLHLFTHVYPYSSRVYSCLPMFTTVYSCLFDVYPCLLVFTYAYTCLHMLYLFTRVYLCLPIFHRV